MTTMKALRIATCQFAIEADIRHNRRWILKQIEKAADQVADLVQFPNAHFPVMQASLFQTSPPSIGTV
jgi:predicted amidohydrolase